MNTGNNFAYVWSKKSNYLCRNFVFDNGYGCRDKVVISVYKHHPSLKFVQEKITQLSAILQRQHI
jgi:hypothetical protein